MSGQGRTCYGCDNYYTSYFCGYEESRCKVYGSIDCGQHERHPDTAAATCKDYTPKKPKATPSEWDRIRRIQRSLWPNGYKHKGGTHHE